MKNPDKTFRLNVDKMFKPLNYKNILLLRNYITVSGKIIPKRLNKLSSKRQRNISKAIKNARLMNFLPFVRLIES
uniref:Small ribosomal subunit protein bS18c n=1 Tax=Pseudocodium devriesii TaxID=453070 RepID=A0A386B149_9CHLO|nr:ribosomal protein S18 [Pseudocodium devriesii]AYC65417.1 ribosomal protein S18 [Pseudocodium devriesii]